MRQIDRGRYTKSGTYSYADSPQTIGYAVTISAPHMHVHALEVLKNHLQPGMKALDVGSGSGYLTACMAMMVSYFVIVFLIIRFNSIGLDFVKSCVGGLLGPS